MKGKQSRLTGRKGRLNQEWYAGNKDKKALHGRQASREGKPEGKHAGRPHSQESR